MATTGGKLWGGQHSDLRTKKENKGSDSRAGARKEPLDVLRVTEMRWEMVQQNCGIQKKKWEKQRGPKGEKEKIPGRCNGLRAIEAGKKKLSEKCTQLFRR